LNLDKDVAPELASNAKLWVAAWRVQSWVDVKRYSDGFYSLASQLLAERRKNPKNPDEDPASSLLMERDSKGEPLEEFHLV
jgi:cytochrome P450